jgi:hypothetical protein
MTDYRVVCTKSDSKNNRITHIGCRENILKEGIFAAPIIFTIEEAIERIRAATDTFFTQENGKHAEIEVVEGNNAPYLRTNADSSGKNNLDELVECT